jgi:transcription-repair coupling factor (superfamily II helicase)
VYSYSDEQPYRIEFFGEEVDSVRAFNPVDQLSVRNLDFVSLVPDVQGKILRENRGNFLSFIPNDSIIWLRESELLFERIRIDYQKALDHYE